MAQQDPLGNYNFRIQMGGVEAGHFTECSGLHIDVEAIPYREGGLNQIVHRLPGRVEYGDVELRYGLTSSTELWAWMQTVVAGKTERKDVSIIMLETDGSTETLRWNLSGAWPSRWRGAPMDAMGREVAIESLTLVFDTVNRE